MSGKAFPTAYGGVSDAGVAIAIDVGIESVKHEDVAGGHDDLCCKALEVFVHFTAEIFPRVLG